LDERSIEVRRGFYLLKKGDFSEIWGKKVRTPWREKERGGENFAKTGDIPIYLGRWTNAAAGEWMGAVSPTI